MSLAPLNKTNISSKAIVVLLAIALLLGVVIFNYTTNLRLLQFLVVGLALTTTVAMLLILKLKQDLQKQQAHCQAVDNEVTRQKEAQNVLHRQTAFLQTLMDTIPAPVFYKDTHGNYTGCNTAFENFIGCPRASLIGKKVNEVAPESLAKVYRQKDHELLAEKGTQMYVGEVRDATGVNRTVLFHKALFSDDQNEPAGIIGVMSDITDLQRMQDELARRRFQLQALTHRLSMVEEQERRKLAEDLHDRVGQTLALTKIKIGAFAGKLMDDPEAMAQLKDIQKTLNTLISETRTLCFELSPPILYELGLQAAIEWLADWYMDEYSIKLNLKVSQIPLDLDVSIRVNVFRAVRELLINAAKHGHPEQVDLAISKNGGKLTVVVTDNGIGFDKARLESTVSGNQGFGLLNIGERFEHMGGKITIQSGRGAGTRVTLETPLNLDKKLTENNHGN